MKDYIYLNKVRAMLLLATMMMAACSTDDDNHAPDDDSDTLQLVAYTQMATDDETLMTRGLTIGNLGNYSLYKGPNTIGLFLTNGTTAPTKASTVTWNQINETTGEWRSQVSVKPIEYMIYGFMPTSFENAPDFTYSISTRNASDNYTTGAKLTFTNLPPIAAEDFCLLTGVQDLGGDETTPLDMKRGEFNYRGREKGKNFVNLMFEHLYAGLMFQMKVGTTYSQLRTIKLKELKLKTSTSFYSVNWEVLVSPKTDESTPYSVTSTALFHDNTPSEVTLFTSDEGLTLTTTAQPIRGYVYAFQNSNGTDHIGRHLSIVSTYDVYDRKGNLIRENCTAENNIVGIADETWKVGTRIVVPLTVEPTYLYVLSEPDLDNPTIKIN